MNIWLDSIKNVALIALFAYPLTRFLTLQRAMNMIPAKNDNVKLALVFGGLSVFGNLATTAVFNQAILNTGLIGAIVGGIIAGPAVGFSAGLLGGLHRLSMKGFTATPDSIAIALGGLIGGLFYLRFKEDRMIFLYSFGAGIMGSALQSLLIFVLAEPAILAKTFLKWTGVATLLTNGVGTGIFTSIVYSVQRRQYSIGTSYVKKATEIAQKTLPVIKVKMDGRVAQELVEIIYSTIDTGAVAITNGETVLAIKGDGSRSHPPGSCDLVLAKDFIYSQEEYIVANSKKAIDCKVSGCPHDAVIIAPLCCGSEKLGFLQVYKVGDVVHPPDIQLVTGVANMLSAQFQNEKQAQLLARAEYAALRSQINPHFLFNTLSAIKRQIRENPTEAQSLLLALASFFRRTLESGEDMIPLSEELKCIEFYVTIQQARFGDRLKVEYEISPECMAFPIPSFTVQPLVENCFNHGFIDGVDTLIIKIIASNEQGVFTIRVADNGVGFPVEVIMAVREDKVTRKMGVGLTNVNRRLRSIYGHHCNFYLGNLSPGAFVEIHIQPEG